MSLRFLSQVERDRQHGLAQLGVGDVDTERFMKDFVRGQRLRMLFDPRFRA